MTRKVLYPISIGALILSSLFGWYKQEPNSLIIENLTGIQRVGVIRLDARCVSAVAPETTILGSYSTIRPNNTLLIAHVMILVRLDVDFAIIDDVYTRGLNAALSCALREPGWDLVVLVMQTPVTERALGSGREVVVSRADISVVFPRETAERFTTNHATFTDLRGYVNRGEAMTTFGIGINDRTRGGEPRLALQRYLQWRQPRP